MDHLGFAIALVVTAIMVACALVVGIGFLFHVGWSLYVPAH